MSSASRPDPTNGAPDEGLLRVIGPFALAASVVNTVVGGGIFVLPAVLAGLMGPAAPSAFLAGALVMALVTISFARAGARVARSGGAAAYAEAAFGPLVGFLAGALFWLSCVLASAAVASALLSTLATAWSELALPVTRGLAIVGLFAVLAAVNARSVRAGTRFAVATAIAKFAALLLFLALGMLLMKGENLDWAAPQSLSALGRGTILVIFALAGMEVPLGASGEVRAPARSVPRALLLALVAVTLLYVAIQFVAQGVLGAALAESAAPLADALATGGGGGRAFILAAGAISMLGYLSSDLLGISRWLFAQGRAAILPRALGRLDETSRSPRVAVWTQAALSAALALSGTFAILAPLATVAILLLYAAGCGAAIVFARRAGESPRRMIVPALAIAALAWVLAQSTAREFLAVGAALVVAAVIYALRRNANSVG